MHIAILGAGGRIGSVLLYGLRRAMPGAVVTGCTRNPEAAEERGLLAFHPAYDDWSKLGKVDVLVNAVGVIREIVEDDFARAHGGISSLIVCNRDEIGEPKVVQISALGADEAAPERFFQTKGAADRMLLQAGNAVVVRPSVVCTSDTLFLHGLYMLRAWAEKAYGVLPVPAGMPDTRVQPVCMADLVELVATLCSTNNHPPVIDLTGPEVYSLRDLFAMRPPGGRRIRTVELPVPLVQSALSVLRFFVPSFPVGAEQLCLLLQDNTAANDEARRLLGRDLRSTLPFWNYALGESAEPAYCKAEKSTADVSEILREKRTAFRIESPL